MVQGGRLGRASGRAETTLKCDLHDNVALVTGAAGAIGSAIARRLTDNGAKVVVADINLAGAENVAAGLADALAVGVDIRDRAAVEAAVGAVMKRYGRLDVLVNNAGVNTFANRVTLDQFPVEEWERVTSIDLDGLFLMSRAALQPMLAAGRGGRIINIASVVGLAALRLQSAFVAAKAGIIHLTRSMALELGPKGILTNAIAHGSIMTDGTRSLFYGADGTFAGRTAEFMGHIPLGRPGTTEEIAEAVLFLASPGAAYINGQVLAVDGGWTAGYAAAGAA
jgi:3-oxoacyl-[acyl-carrier protein] reductase/2-deoxy-D-gluconate 3-dehydrogenase